jgi:RNA polymerase sigma factor (sigma-70 family)
MSSTARFEVQPLLRKALSTSTLLTAERERELLLRYHANEDKAAMDELVRSHMPVIFRVAGQSARNARVDINDLVQTATEGLLIAINRWSFEKAEAGGARYVSEVAENAVQASGPVSMEAVGQELQPVPESPRSSRLATYAMWWMRILLADSVIGSRGVVIRAKNPNVRKALFGLPMAMNKLAIRLPLSGGDVSRIAAYLGIGEREIEEALLHAAGDVMLDEPVGDGSMLRGETIPDERAEGEDGILNRLVSADRWDAVCAALMDLPARHRFILIARYLLKWKLDQVSDTIGLSPERIRQIGVEGLSRIRQTINRAGNSASGSDRRRPGRLPYVHPSLIPLLRNAANLVDHDVRASAGRNPVHRCAAVEVEALANAIERASASSDPEAMAALLRDQQIKSARTRIVSRPPATIEARPMTCFRVGIAGALTSGSSELELTADLSRQAEQLTSETVNSIAEIRVA